VILIFLVFLVLIIISPILFFVFVKKFDGFKEVTIIFVSLTIMIIAWFYFFGNSDADIINQKLSESNLKLNNQYKILNSNKVQTLIDYYTDYDIQITDEDKLGLSNKIKNSKKFRKIKQNDYDSYWKNEYEKELINNQTVRNYNLDEYYFRTITFPNSSRKMEIRIDTIKNKLRLTDSAD